MLCLLSNFACCCVQTNNRQHVPELMYQTLQLFTTRSASKCLMDATVKCTAQWISHAKVLSVFKTWVWRREILKKPNSQLCTRPAGKTITSKSWPELLWEAFSLLNLQKIYAFFVQDGKYSALFVGIPSLPTDRTWTCEDLCFWCQ